MAYFLGGVLFLVLMTLLRYLLKKGPVGCGGG